MTKVLLSVGLKQFRRSLTQLSIGKVLLVIAVGLIATIFLYILLSFIFGLGELNSITVLKLISPWLLLSGAMVTFLFGIPQVFKHLFSAKDVEMLFSLPIPTRSIFWVKYIQSFMGTSFFVWLLLIMIFTTYGIGANLSLEYYVIFPIVSICAVGIGLALAYLVNLVLIQILPPQRANELMVVVSSLAGILIYISVQLPNLLGRTQLTNEVITLVPEAPAWLPTSWAGNAILSAAEGYWDAWVNVGAILLFTLAISGAASMLVEGGFRRGWIRLSEGGRKKRKGQKQQTKLTLSHPIYFIGSKDWKSIKRDPREWMTFLPFLIVIFIPAINGLSNPEGFRDLMSDSLLSWVIVQVYFVVIFSMIVGTFTASSIGREGSTVWLLRTLPLSGMQIALGKIWIHWLIPMIFVSAIEMGVGIFLEWALIWILGGILTIGVISIGMSSIGLWGGTVGAKYNPGNPQQRLETGTSFLMIFVNFIYLLALTIPVVMILMPKEYASFFTEAAENSGGFIEIIAALLGFILNAKSSNEIIIVIIGILLLVGVVWYVTRLFLQLSARRIDRGIQVTMVEAKSRK